MDRFRPLGTGHKVARSRFFLGVERVTLKVDPNSADSYTAYVFTSNRSWNGD
jgi:hypothetical protein